MFFIQIFTILHHQIIFQIHFSNPLMKKILFVCCFFLGLAVNAQNHQEKMLRHVVLFKFKAGTSAEEIKKVEATFRALPSKIKEIKGFEFGINNSPETHDQGFTHCYLLTFSSEADRAIYLPHPDHQAFGKVLGPFLDKVLVVDYWAGQ